MKKYKNGSTRETIYQDTALTKAIGYLNPREEAECWGLIDGRPLIVYKVDGKNYKKTGFAKWTGGIR